MTYDQIRLHLLNSSERTATRGIQEDEGFGSCSTGVGVLTSAGEFFMIFIILDSSILAEIDIDLLDGQLHRPHLEHVRVLLAVHLNLATCAEDIGDGIRQAAMRYKLIMDTLGITIQHMRVSSFIDIKTCVCYLPADLFGDGLWDEDGGWFHQLGVAESTTDGIKSANILHAPNSPTPTRHNLLQQQHGVGG